MGNLFTKSVPPATAEGIKVILDTILKEMFKRADFIDLYSLADPERCKRYIVVAESALQKLFVKVQLQPRLGADGTFMVQKLEGLQKKNPLGDLQPKYCLELAFYFIRIFQIYAALALSVLDNDLPTQEIQAIRKTEEAIHEGALLLQPDLLKGFPKEKPRSTGLFSFFGRGGALEGNPGSQYRTFYLDQERAGPYTILNLFLNRPIQGMASMDDMRFAKYPDMLMPQAGLYEFEGGQASARQTSSTLLSQPPAITYTLPAGDLNTAPQTVHARLRLQRDGQRLLVGLVEGKLESLPEKAPVSVTGELFYPTSTSDNPKSKTGQDLPDLLISLFKEVAKEARPTAVSAIPFLQKFKLIRRFEGEVPIEGTRISISNPKQLFVAGITDIPITYRGKFKPEKGAEERSITIETLLSISKRQVIVGKPHEYTVTVRFENMEVEPAAFTSRVTPSQKTASSTFQTGLNDTDTPRNERAKTVPEFLQALFDRIVAGEATDLSTGGIEFKKGIPQPYNSDTLPPPLKVKALWQALARDPPIKSYCVARAVQLLNVAAIRGAIGPETFTNACRMKFPYVQEGYVPAPGKTITTVPGIRAVELLFFDMIEKGSPKIAATDKYAKFVQGMKSVFEGAADAAVSATDTLEGVKDSVAAAACDGRPDERMPVAAGAASGLRKQALALVDRQKVHLSNVMRLLYKMFDQQALHTRRELAFNPTFAAGGMPAVTRLAEEARELLIEYYSQCERLYKEGLSILATKAPTSVTGPVVTTT